MNPTDNKAPEPMMVRLTARQTSIIGASAVLSMFFIFIAGYFYGQQRAAEQFTFCVEQESLADQVYSSLCGLYDNKGESESGEEAEMVQADASDVAAEANEQYSIEADCATMVVAQQCAARLRAAGLQSSIKEQQSYHNKKNISWYQVATVPTTDKKGLNECIEKIKNVDKLKNIRLVTA